MSTPRSLLCRCLYEIGATPPSKLQLLTNGFNETGMLFVLPRAKCYQHANNCGHVVADISQHVWNINAETGEVLRVPSALPRVLPEISLG